MKKETKKAEERVQTACPICVLFEMGSRLFGRESEFFKHLTNARIEFLLAVKSLIEKRIESLEKSKGGASKYSKIEVEE
jgi:hypothetical protein